jgi:hypothetical protein
LNTPNGVADGRRIYLKNNCLHLTDRGKGAANASIESSRAIFAPSNVAAKSSACAQAYAGNGDGCDSPREAAPFTLPLLWEQHSAQEYGGCEDVIGAKSDYMPIADPIDRRSREFQCSIKKRQRSSPHARTRRGKPR